MTFIRKFSGDRTAPMRCVYTCPEHGAFTAEVQRDDRGEAPDEILCLAEMGARADAFAPAGQMLRCTRAATWTPSPVVGRVRLIEVARGKWEKPEQKTFLDTRELGEGQDPDEFWKKREKVWDEERHKLVKDLTR